MTIPSHLDTLLAEDRWARRLARALVREGEDPEDLVQEAYARSVAHLAGSGRWAPAEPRAWLGRVLRNVLAELRRARGTREQRELERARESSEQKHDARAVHVRGAGHLGHTSSDVRAGPVDCEPTPDELAARAEVQERLAAAVLALEPRQRDVVLLRHFDGASVADIARRLGRARATVHEHLERGHAEPRRVLSTIDDDRRMTRGLALLVAAGDAPRAATVAATVDAISVSPSLPLFLIVMNATKSLAAVVLVAALSFVAWRAVAPPDVALSTLGEPEGVTLQPSAKDGSDRELPLQVASSRAPRAPLATPEVPRSESGNATLRVRVVDEDNLGVHLAGVVVDIDGEDRDRTKPRTVVETDSDGYWSSAVPAGKALVVDVNREDTSPGRVNLTSIASDTTFETTVRVRTRPDLDLVFSVVDAVTQEPIGGARGFIEAMSVGISGRDVLVLQPEAASDFVTVADGTARVRVKSWLNVSSRVHADGYAPREQSVHRRTVEASHSVEPVVVSLTRGARIAGRVAGAPAVSEVRATFPSSTIQAPEVVSVPAARAFRARNYELRVPVSDDGEFIVPDVPGGTAVALALRDSSSGALLYEPATPVVTVAGEVHHVAWDLGATRRIVCTVREATGEAAADIRVLLFAHGNARVGATEERPRGWSPSARTDAAGVAVFDAVAQGAWLVGLAPSGKGERAFAAYTIGVDVTETPGDVHVELSLHRGLYIQGRVVTPEGGEPSLSVSAHNGQFHVSAHRPDIVDGQFRLGPLLPGLYTVSVLAFTSGDGPSCAPPPEVEVAAGTTGLELVLRPGARLVLRAIDAASRAPVDAEFVLARVDREGGHFQGGGTKASARFTGLAPGTYCTLALAADGRVGVLESIPLPSTEPVEAVVPLAPGADSCCARRSTASPATCSSCAVTRSSSCTSSSAARRSARSCRPDAIEWA